jgi:hypothetical protein
MMVDKMNDPANDRIGEGVGLFFFYILVLAFPAVVLNAAATVLFQVSFNFSPSLAKSILKLVSQITMKPGIIFFGVAAGLLTLAILVGGNNNKY